ncbi:MAG: hypothetical protein MUO76_01920 [Anaerolineaceae bacterium]|nr:hypothetical protein [Anaerolineaceae bacterium]
MFKNIIRVLGGDPIKKELNRLDESVVADVNAMEQTFEQLSDEALKAKTSEFRKRLANEETLADLMAEAFAAVREASKRTLGLRHFNVQIICGAALHEGQITEMRTGEGKTLAATMPLYLNALEGRGVHLVTVNDYLARRDARWMAPIFDLLGMNVGVLQMAARTDGAKKAFLIDLERTSPHEDRDQLLMVSRKEAYAADITYGTNSEFGFDYLRDNQAIRLEDRVQRGHHYAIIDEVDNILIDEARTPLIISGPASDDTAWYYRMAQVVDQLRVEDYEVLEKDRSVSMTDVGEAHLEDLLDMSLRDPERPEDITPEQARVLGFLEQSLRAKHLFKRNKDYLVQAGRVIIVDSSTGRMMPGRRWSEGLHQAVEAKEGLKVNPENVTYATITLQNYYRMYEKLAGMTGTALTEAEEFDKIYSLEVLPVPTNLEYIVSQEDSDLEALKTRDEFGYEYVYYARKDDSDSKPVFWKRKDYTDVVFRTTEAKLRAIADEVIRFHIMGRPQLVGTTSVENSDVLSRRLQAKWVKQLLQVHLVRDKWMEENGIEFIDRSYNELKTLNIPLDDLDPGKMRAITRELGVKLSLNLEEPQNIKRLLKVIGLSEADEPRLMDVIKGGVPHLVLNARKHDEESQMIERAGAFGAVTIATNMAGRGVDIKLGGELPERVFNDVVLVLDNMGYDPYEMTFEQRQHALEKISLDKLSVVRAESIKTFLQHARDMEKVKALGGLHVIGSERYEARRIDNQLRGRAARQGDPGSSRYYLSLEDDLMRLFGGQQVESLWGRVFLDDSQPLEMKILGRIVEQSQERVEGANFDARKHVLEYDDVLNSQRKRIYAQRERVFTKVDLSEDILDMLRSELQERIPLSLNDEEGPWKLMAYLDQIQPVFEYDRNHFPSFPMSVLLAEIRKRLKGTQPTVQDLRTVLLGIAERALFTRNEHHIRGARILLETAEINMKRQLEERYDTLDMVLDGLSDHGMEGGEPSPQEILAEISSYAHSQIKLTSNELRLLPEADPDVIEKIRQQIEAQAMGVTIKRVVGALERRLGEDLDVQPDKLQDQTWDDVCDQLLETLERSFENRMQQLLGGEGLIARDIDSVIPRLEGSLLSDPVLILLLTIMTQGSRLAFDSKTHQKKTRRFTRLTYHFLVAQLLDDLSSEDVTEQILNHLEEALRTLQKARGLLEWKRLAQTGVHLSQLDNRLQQPLIDHLGLEHFEKLANLSLDEFAQNESQLVMNILGEYLQNVSYRETLVRVISSQWVEYLTQVEALRVSIAMEAYAQRDPLVQYKSKASEMFAGLLADIRIGVISKVFTYRQRSGVEVSSERERLPLGDDPAAAVQTAGKSSNKKGKKKRTRH